MQKTLLISLNATKMIKEVPVPGVNGIVRISESGKEVWYNGRKLKMTLIKSNSHAKGYLGCSFNGKFFYIHKLVALVFVTNPEPLKNKMVNHVDRDTLNNHYKNLIWSNKAKKYIKNPESRGSSKLTYKEALIVAERLDKGEKGYAIAKEFNTSEMSINRIRKKYCEVKQASPRYSQEIISNALKLCRKHSMKDVAKISGIGYATIRRWNNRELKTP